MTTPPPPLPPAPASPLPPGSGGTPPGQVIGITVLAVVILLFGVVLLASVTGGDDDEPRSDAEASALASALAGSPTSSPTPESPVVVATVDPTPAAPTRVQVPPVVGLSLDTALDVAFNNNLTGMTVCETVGGDLPLWWPNWKVLTQSVPAGTWVMSNAEICLGAIKKQDL